MNEEYRRWVRKIPEVFFEELYKLHWWIFKSEKHQHPGYVGKFINQYVYEALPEDVLERLRAVNPRNSSGNRVRRHQQHLTEEQGVTHLEDQIKETVTLMELADSKKQFHRSFTKLHPTNPEQKELALDLD